MTSRPVRSGATAIRFDAGSPQGCRSQSWVVRGGVEASVVERGEVVTALPAQGREPSLAVLNRPGSGGGSTRAGAVQNGGYLMFRPEIFDYLEKDRDLIADVCAPLARKGRMSAWACHGRCVSHGWTKIDRCDQHGGREGPPREREPARSRR